MQGVLSDGAIVAIKQLSSKSNQGSREFINEIGMISTLQHPNLVKLYGFCMEDDQLLLIYEYMENNSLAHALFGNYFSQCSSFVVVYVVIIYNLEHLTYLFINKMIILTNFYQPRKKT
jgi:serine/threonine protein kinase